MFCEQKSKRVRHPPETPVDGRKSSQRPKQTPNGIDTVSYVTVCRFLCHGMPFYVSPFSMSRYAVFYVTVYRFLCHGLPFSMSRYAVFYVTVCRFLCHGIPFSVTVKTCRKKLTALRQHRPSGQQAGHWAYRT